MSSIHPVSISETGTAGKAIAFIAAGARLMLSLNMPSAQYLSFGQRNDRLGGDKVFEVNHEKQTRDIRRHLSSIGAHRNARRRRPG
jgi:hypothetical protein